MQSAFAIILSFYVLCGSIGTPLYKHICLASEEIKYSVHSNSSCCNDSTESTEKVISIPECCHLISSYFQVNYDAFSVARDYVLNASVEFISLSSEFPAVIVDSLKNTHFPEREPVHFSGRTLLAFIQSFLI